MKTIKLLLLLYININIIYFAVSSLENHINSLLKENNDIKVLNSYHDNNNKFIVETPTEYYNQLSNRVANAVIRIFHQNPSVKNDLIKLTLNLLINFACKSNDSHTSWYALSILYDETELKSGYTFLHRVIVDMNNEKFQLFPSNCKPLSNLLLIASTKYNKTEKKFIHFRIQK